MTLLLIILLPNHELLWAVLSVFVFLGPVYYYIASVNVFE